MPWNYANPPGAGQFEGIDNRIGTATQDWTSITDRPAAASFTDGAGEIFCVVP